MLSPLPGITNSKIIIIPVYNDASTLRKVVEELLLQSHYTIIVVDDGSAVPVSNCLTGLPFIYLRHRVNLGQGAALQTGFTYALQLQPDIIITFDADGQHIASDIPLLIQPILNKEADVVLGSRFWGHNDNPIPFSRNMILKGARLINYLLCGILLSDAHNGLRAFSSAALGKVTITENRMAHASEILFEIKRHKLRYKEVPVNIYYTDYSRQKGQSAVDSIKVLFDLILHKLFL
ncbi:glycosyltransferase family 2 protein [Paraflavitalea speifideaquila]|uniref:glycosyltransferase family 2 protein n=1 Tax=Paraflavitalea speifideaquila TaxID=3076558 RepID=UPI0028EE5BDA|nr:glycosyltransferase family 2 protein [Paraflavitalea speifideiaquila]